MWASRFLARSPAAVGLVIRFLFIGSRLCSTLLSDPASRRRPCALLSLHLHQVVKRTSTSKLSIMLGTQENGREKTPGRLVAPLQNILSRSLIWVGRLKVCIFRRAVAGFTAEAVVKRAERFQHALFAGCQVRVGKRGLGNGVASGSLLDVRRPSPDSGGRCV